MTRIQIKPQKLKGTVTVPPSKSLAHRAIICAGLAHGKSRIENIEYSQDILATIDAMKALGTTITKEANSLIIDGTTTFSKDMMNIDCKESGSTLRFMIPISLVHKKKVHFIGEGNLGKRPLDTYYEIFDNQCIEYIYKQDVLDLHILGHLNSGIFKIPGNISSQFITGLLFSLPLLEGDSIIEITSSLESKGYIDLTLDMLNQYGIKIENDNYQRFIIPGNQEYKVHDYRVEADFSQAAFYLVGDALGNDIILKDLNLDSKQGDKAVLDILIDMGCKIEENDEGIKLIPNSLQSLDVDASQCPDIIPVLSLALALASGRSKVYNAKRLRIKECDRLEAINNILKIFSVDTTMEDESIVIEGTSIFKGGDCPTYDDHRIAMMLAIASTCSKQPITIDNKECVKKSYPSFWEDFLELGGQFDVISMEK